MSHISVISNFVRLFDSLLNFQPYFLDIVPLITGKFYIIIYLLMSLKTSFADYVSAVMQVP